MTRLARDLRLIPIVLIAAGSLLLLKIVGIVSEGGYTLGAGHLAKSDRLAREAAALASNQLLRAPATVTAQAAEPERPAAKQSWAQEMFNYPGDVTGSVGNQKSGDKKDAEKKDAEKKDAPKKDAKPAEPKPTEPKPSAGGAVIPLDAKPVSPAERALLERLTERRQELDQRERELQVRETLLQAQEKRLESKAVELKDIEARIVAATKKKEETENARLKSLVTMYENMKAKEAAKIFDRLDIRLATEVANQIAPRRMSDILAQMSPEAAERLTVELANRNQGADKVKAADLPKIEGKPNAN